MPKLSKKKSKRVTTRKRTKIEKKVREHNRKVKKEAKKNPNPSKKKKGFDVPNNCPFKDTVLKEAEDHKRRLEEERQRQKDKRKKEREIQRSKKRLGLSAMVADAQRRSAEFDKKKAAHQGSDDLGQSKNVELSLKQYYREFKRVVEAADVVLEVLDARDPLGSRCPQVEEAVLGAGPNKRLVLLLNKVDLVPRENVEQWLKHLRLEYPTIAFKASTQSQNEHLSQSRVPLTLASEDLRKSSRCLGAELLLKLLGNYCRNKDIRTSISVGVVGFPNTGKSSVINSLKRAKVCNVGATPGVTKSLQSVQLDKHVKLLDSPGIVMASGSDPSNVLKNCVRVEALDDPIPAVDAVLRRCTKQKVMIQYGLPDFTDVHEFLALLAKKQGRLKKGGLPDTTRAARSVLLDWNQGRITYYTHPPEKDSAASQLGAQIVTEMSKEFDISSLLQQEEETLKGLRAVSTNDVVFTSAGPTDAGVTMDTEYSEDLSDVDELAEESEEEMEEDDHDEEKYTVSVTTSKPKPTGQKATQKAKDDPIADVEMTLEGNQMLNQARKKAFKKMKKQRRKDDATAGKLADAMEEAFESMGSLTNDDNYDFGTDFK